MSYVIETPVIPSLRVDGTDKLFPIHRIYCVGRNYADHAREMGYDPDREPPFFFQKNPDTIVPSGGKFPYPDRSKNVHYEIELVAALSKGGKNISNVEALNCIFGYAVGLDMTRRDLQSEAKKLGRPWEVGKAFDFAAPCSDVYPISKTGHPENNRIWFKVNGELKQEGYIDQLIWNVAEIIRYLSELFTLAPGDLIFTGTPAGVGSIQQGDSLEGGVEGIGDINITVT